MNRGPLLIALATLLSACASQEERDYRISHVTRKDIVITQRILRNVAVESGLVEDTAWTDYEIYARYMAPNVYLRAFGTMRGDLVIELSRMAWPTPKTFKQADQLLEVRLSTVFRQRMSRKQFISGHCD